MEKKNVLLIPEKTDGWMRVKTSDDIHFTTSYIYLPELHHSPHTPHTVYEGPHAYSIIGTHYDTEHNTTSHNIT